MKSLIYIFIELFLFVFGVQNVSSQLYYNLQCKLVLNTNAIQQVSKVDILSSNKIVLSVGGNDTCSIFLSNKKTDLQFVSHGIMRGDYITTSSPIINLDTIKDGKTYYLSVDEIYVDNNVYIQTVACQIVFSINRFDPFDRSLYLCEGKSLYLKKDIIEMCNKSKKHEPKISISPRGGTEQWKEIKQSNLTFESFKEFVRQNFPNKSIFVDRFKIKIEFLLFETESVSLPLYYQNYPIKETNPSIIDNKLYANLQQEDEISVNSYFAQVQNRSFNYSNFDTDGFLNYNFNGPYRLIFSRKDHCPVERYVFVPEVQYNKVNDSENVFWYEKEKRNAVTLNYKYPSDSTEKLDFNHYCNKYCKITTTSNHDGKILVYSLYNNSITDSMVCKYSSFDFMTDKNLKKIDVTIKSDNDKKFVPVYINLNELKFYPNITTEDSVRIAQPSCNYSDAILTFPKFEGGLKNGYFYQIDENEPLQIPEDNKIVVDDKLKSFTLKVFDNTEKIDTIGRIARSLDLGKIDINRPQSIEFLDTVSTNLSCYHDKTGSFEVNKVQLSYPEKAVTYNWYKFPYSETDKLSISESVAGGLAAGNYIVVVENNGCKDTAYFTLSEPDFPLEISIDTVNNPVCFGYSDGKIVTHATGGTKGDGYKFSWNNGSQDTAIYNLKAGTYILSVTDSHGCKGTATQELVDPEELQNSLTPSHTICKNGELKIDEGDLKSDELHYSWLLPNGNVHNERVLVVKSDMPEGNYVMISQDTSGCFTADTTNIKFSDNELNIKFLAPTYSYLGDTVVLAEDSEFYKNFSWSYVFNENMFTDITSSMSGAPYNHTFLESFKSGSDTITMYANDGHCNASFSKEVNILNEQRSDYSNYEAPSVGIFTRLAIGPSPNDGNFTLYANLTEEAALDVFILDLQTALKIPLKYDSKFESDHYAIPVHNLNLLKGVYALFVTANGDTKYIKFTIK